LTPDKYFIAIARQVARKSDANVNIQKFIRKCY